jgi:hypothetical protein
VLRAASAMEAPACFKWPAARGSRLLLVRDSSGAAGFFLVLRCYGNAFFLGDGETALFIERGLLGTEASGVEKHVGQDRDEDDCDDDVDGGGEGWVHGHNAQLDVRGPWRVSCGPWTLPTGIMPQRQMGAKLVELSILLRKQETGCELCFSRDRRSGTSLPQVP